MRVAGHHVEQTWEVLSVPQRTRFVGLPKEMRRVFHRVNDLLAACCSPADAALNCELDRALGIPRREPGRGQDSGPPGASGRVRWPAISLAMEQMLADLKRSWRAGELAKALLPERTSFFSRI